MRDKLKELIKVAKHLYQQDSAFDDLGGIDMPTEDDYIATTLLAYKVKVFPCDVGDPVYFIIEDTNETYISEDRITDVSTKGFFCSSTVGENDNDDFYPYSDVGVSAFFDKAEAEQALKARDNK